MATSIIRHKVNDYEIWKKEFDNFSHARKSGGEKSYRIMHVSDDPNDIIVINDWENLDKARDFVGSADLKEAMQRAGVIEAPQISFLESHDQGVI